MYTCMHVIIQELLTKEDIAMKSCVFWGSSTNIGPPLLPLSEVCPGDIEHHPVSPLTPLGVTPTRSIGIWKNGGLCGEVLEREALTCHDQCVQGRLLGWPRHDRSILNLQKTQVSTPEPSHIFSVYT